MSGSSKPLDSQGPLKSEGKLSHSKMKTVGVISDTHGLIRPEALDALMGVDLIVHAGDIGAPGIIDALRRIAPVHAIRGNVDRGFYADEFSPTEIVEVDGQSLYVLHDLYALDLDPVAAGFRAVISGHTHDPAVKEERGVVYLNPGSAGPRRFKLPISLARMSIGEDDDEAQHAPAMQSNRYFLFGDGPQRITVELILLL
jgi:putative phosphoesterase